MLSKKHSFGTKIVLFFWLY